MRLFFILQWKLHASSKIFSRSLVWIENVVSAHIRDCFMSYRFIKLPLWEETFHPWWPSSSLSQRKVLSWSCTNRIQSFLLWIVKHIFDGSWESLCFSTIVLTNQHHLCWILVHLLQSVIAFIFCFLCVTRELRWDSSRSCFRMFAQLRSTELSGFPLR